MKRKTKLVYFLGAFIICAAIASCTKPGTGGGGGGSTPNTPPTSLQFTIYDGSGAYRVISPGALAQLFPTDSDRAHKTNALTGLVASNSQGILTFNNLQPINYFFNAYSADMTKSNATTFNQTDPLTAGIVNKLSPVVK